MIGALRRLASAASRAREVEVRVGRGYRPSRIEAVAGAPLRLVFDRREAGSCSREVVFPGLGLTARLAPYAKTAVELAPDRPGEYPFRCGKGRLHGTLVVVPASPPASASALPRISWP